MIKIFIFGGIFRPQKCDEIDNKVTVMYHHIIEYNYALNEAKLFWDETKQFMTDNMLERIMELFSISFDQNQNMICGFCQS